MRIYLVISFIIVNIIFAQAQTLLTDADILSKSIDQSKAIGIVAGSAGVTVNGAATYSIPIFTPDGINGMKPNISINYNSNAGNGLLGYGWRLNAISVITYDTKDNYYENIPAPKHLKNIGYVGENIGFSPYLLDGERLVPFNGSTTEFRTAGESFKKIVASGAASGCSACPNKFVIYEKSGLELEYSTLLLSSTGGAPVSWYLTKETDKLGNYIQYSYIPSDGEMILDKIEYTLNTSVADIYKNWIQFNYSPKADMNEYYPIDYTLTNNSIDVIKVKNKLDNIDIYSENNTHVKKYSFVYGNDGLYTYLNKIVETGYELDNTAIELNSTDFKYGIANETQISSESFSGAVVTGKKADIFPGDFNGDGLDDIFVAYYNSDARGKKYSDYKFFLRNTTGTGFNTSVGANTFPITTYWNGGSSGPTCSLYLDIKVTDLDGNGKDDISFFKNGKVGSVTRLLGVGNIYANTTGNSFSTQNYNDITCNNRVLYYTGDFDGDKRTDIITFNFNTSSATSGELLLHLPAKNLFNISLSVYDTAFIYENEFACIMYYSNMIKILDFDGDGKDDIVYKTSAPCTNKRNGIFTITKDIYNQYHPKNINFYGNLNYLSFSINNENRLGDFNGDGKKDIIEYLTTTNQFKIKYSTGFKQTNWANFTLGEPIDTQKIRLNTELFDVADFNGDGKSDVLHYYTPTGSPTVRKLAVYYSNGINFKREEFIIPTMPTTFLPSQTADFNGDGQADVLDTLNTGNGSFYINFIKPKTQSFLLTKIKDGHERLTEFTYKLPTEGSVVYSYTNPTTNLYPYNTIVPKSFVVQKMTVPDGSGSMANTTYTEYKYTDATTHLLGKGFLGYKNFKTTNALSTVVSEQISDVINTTHVLFAPTETKTYYAAAPATLLSKTTSDYDVVTLDASTKRYLIKVPITIAENRITNSRVENSISMNDLGNIELSIQKIYPCSTCVTTALQTTTTSINNFTSDGTWMEARPNIVTTTNEYNGNSYSTETDYDYYANGLPYTIKTFNNSATKRITTTYEYDALGNLTKHSIAPIGTPARYTRYEYKPNKKTIDKTYTNGVGSVEINTQIVEDYDKRFYAPTQVRNGLYTNLYATTTYDAFGRVKTNVQYPNTITTENSYAYAVATNQIYGVTTTVKNSSNAEIAPKQETFYDRLGRVIKSTTENFSGTTVTSTQTYDAFGRESETSMPDANSGTVTIINSYGGTNFHHRIIGSSNSAAGNTTYDYVNGPNGKSTTTVIAPSGEFKKQTTDAAGKLISSEDAAGTLNYTYNGQGNILTVALGSSNLSTIGYDAVTGRQTSLTEANSGTTLYDYNGYGELIYQKDNKGFEYDMEYDAIGRLKKKTRRAYSNKPNTLPASAFAEETIYAYVISGNGQEQLESVKVGPDVKQAYEYDVQHRPFKYTEKADANNIFTVVTNYNTNNFVDNIEYQCPGTANFKLDYVYTGKGFLQTIKNGTTEIYKTTATNKYNQPTAYTLGNTKASTITYNAIGNPTQYFTPNGATNIQNLNFEFNINTGNLEKRTDKTKGTSPNWQNDQFTYQNTKDRLNTSTTYGGSGTVTINYDDTKNGNIESKTDLGTYAYDGTKLHALTEINFPCTTSVQTLVQEIKYTPFNQPATISNVSNNYLLEYAYNPNNQRNLSILKLNGNETERRYYFGNYEKLVKGSTTKHIYYISGGNGLCAIATKDNSSSSLTFYYVYTDHLGSIVKLTNNTGVTVAEQSFDAWGRVRNPDTWSSYTLPASTILGTHANGTGWLMRGYTGHEHLPQFDNLINMNGRMYDPMNGRMLSPDIYVQDATNTQAYNRYSYAWNNPLKYTDPSGWLNDLPNNLYDNEDDNIGDSWWGSGGGGGGLGSNPGFSNSVWGMISQAWSITNNAGATFGYFTFERGNAGYTLGTVPNNVLNLGSNQYGFEVMTWNMYGSDGMSVLGGNGTSGTAQLYTYDRGVTTKDNNNGNESNKNGVGQPGIGESLIPIWGSARTSVDHFQNGNYGRGILYGALAVSDVFLVKSLVVGAGKLAMVGFSKLAIEESATVAAKGVSEGTHVVYQGFNKAGVVEYVGITGRDAAVRFGEHLNSGTARSLLRYEVVPGATNLSKTGARIWEQNLINQHGLNNLLNVRNSIAPKYWFQYGIKP